MNSERAQGRPLNCPPNSLLFATFVALISYPLLSFLWRYQYPFLTPEVLLILLAVCSVSLILALLASRSRLLVTNMLLILVACLAGILQFNLLFEGAAVLFLSIVGLSLLLRRHFAGLLLAVSLAMLLGALIEQGVVAERTTSVVEQGQDADGLAPVVHLVLDAFIGLEGLPDEPWTEPLKQDIRAFFERNGFEYYPRAYSHYLKTIDSLKHAFNFTNDYTNHYEAATAQRLRYDVSDNRWFTTLARDGYRWNIYQNDGVEFCGSGDTPVAACTNYPIPDLASIHEAVDSVTERVLVILRLLTRKSALFSLQLEKHFDAGRWGVTNYDPALLTSLAEDVAVNPGQAHFAHLLLPHTPYVLTANCTLDYSVPEHMRFQGAGIHRSTPAEREQRYRLYVEQTRCALAELERFFDLLRAEGVYDRSWIILHGDHGSRSTLRKISVFNLDRMTLGDLRDSFSVLYAHKRPEGVFAEHPEVISLNQAITRTASAVSGIQREQLENNMLSEEKPFIYISDSNPLFRINLDIFKPVPDDDLMVEHAENVRR